MSDVFKKYENELNAIYTNSKETVGLHKGLIALETLSLFWALENKESLPDFNVDFRSLKLSQDTGTGVSGKEISFYNSGNFLIFDFDRDEGPDNFLRKQSMPSLKFTFLDLLKDGNLLLPLDTFGNTYADVQSVTMTKKEFSVKSVFMGLDEFLENPKNKISLRDTASYEYRSILDRESAFFTNHSSTMRKKGQSVQAWGVLIKKNNQYIHLHDYKSIENLLSVDIKDKFKDLMANLFTLISKYDEDVDIDLQKKSFPFISNAVKKSVLSSDARSVRKYDEFMWQVANNVKCSTVDKMAFLEKALYDNGDFLNDRREFVKRVAFTEFSKDDNGSFLPLNSQGLMSNFISYRMSKSDLVFDSKSLLEISGDSGNLLKGEDLYKLISEDGIKVDMNIKALMLDVLLKTGITFRIGDGYTFNDGLDDKFSTGYINTFSNFLNYLDLGLDVDSGQNMHLATKNNGKVKFNVYKLSKSSNGEDLKKSEVKELIEVFNYNLSTLKEQGVVMGKRLFLSNLVSEMRENCEVIADSAFKTMSKNKVSKAVDLIVNGNGNNPADDKGDSARFKL